MTENELNKLISDTVSDIITKNIDSFVQETRREFQKDSDKTRTITYANIIEASATYGAMSAISVLKKLHVLDVDKLKNPE